ncbi:SpoIIE family protein phosphatase [Streptomyces californicus]
MLFGTNLAVVRANQRFATVFGGSAEDHRGRTVEDYLPRSEADRLTATLKRVLETGESVTDLQLVGPAPNTTERRHWSMNLYRVHRRSRPPRGHRRTRHRRHPPAHRRAGGGQRPPQPRPPERGQRPHRQLPGPGDHRPRTPRRGRPRLPQPRLRRPLPGPPHRYEAAPGSGASAHRDPAGGSAELRRVTHASAVADALPTAVAGSGAPGPDNLPPALGSVHRFPVGSPCAMALRSRRAEDVPGDEMGFVQSTLAVPMVAHDTVVGLVQFSRTKGSEPFGSATGPSPPSWPPAPPSASTTRASTAASTNAPSSSSAACCPRRPRGRRARRRLPLPAGNAATEVGGDWFDVIELPGHRTALVVGDVMGRGLRAAVAMGELRTAVRTLALLDLEPAEVLYALDEVARGLGSPGGGERSEGLGGSGGAQWPSRAARKSREADLSEVYLATCVYAVYDPVTRRCTIANAGHMPPALVEPGRPARLIDVPPGMPLGVGGEPFEEVEVELAENALLTLYTDGLVESRDQSLDAGLDALRSVLTGPQMELEDACDFVLSTLDTQHGEDDIALLMARIQGLPAEAVGDWTLPREPRSVGRARELARGQLLSWDLDDLVDTTELLVSELVTNALRYGEGENRLRLLRDRTLVCEVWDADRPAAPPPRPRHRRGRTGPATGRAAQRRLGHVPHPARQDGLVRAGPAGRGAGGRTLRGAVAEHLLRPPGPTGRGPGAHLRNLRRRPPRPRPPAGGGRPALALVAAAPGPALALLPAGAAALGPRPRPARAADPGPRPPPPPPYRPVARRRPRPPPPYRPVAAPPTA